MAIIETLNPNFSSITGTQPVGTTQIAVAATYAGTVFTVKRTAERYWNTNTRTVRGCIKAPRTGASAQIWFDTTALQYVVDYWMNNETVEVGRARTLGAAIGLAEMSTASRWKTGNYVR